MHNIIYNLSNEDYHHSPQYSEYLSSSQLKWYMKSPRHYKYMLDHPQEETESMRFGSVFHSCMAGLAQGSSVSDMLDSIAVFEPPLNKTTNKPYGANTAAYRDAYNDFVEKTQGSLIVTPEDKETLTAMLTSLMHNCDTTSEQVGRMLKRGKPEVSIFHETEEGIKIKIRPDLLTRDKIVDWKTTTLDDLTEDSINRTILKYGYHISAALYQWIAHEVFGKWYSFILVFVQKQQPYDCVMVDMANYAYSYQKEWDMVIPGPGAIEFRQLLNLHTTCVKKGEYPGAETFISVDNSRIMAIEPPKYYANKFIEE